MNNNTLEIASKVYLRISEKKLNNNYNKESNELQKAVKILQIQ